MGNNCLPFILEGNVIVETSSLRKAGFVNLLGRTGTFSVKDGKSNLRGRSFSDRSRHSSLHFISLGFSLERRKEGKKERRKEERKKEGRKKERKEERKKERNEDRWFLPEVCSFWWAPPSLFAG
jgi:hypothetical protein